MTMTQDEYGVERLAGLEKLICEIDDSPEVREFLGRARSPIAQRLALEAETAELADGLKLIASLKGISIAVDKIHTAVIGDLDGED